MVDSVGGKILGVTNDISNFWYGLTLSKNVFVVLDILIIAIIIYWGYILIKETRAKKDEAEKIKTVQNAIDYIDSKMG